MATIPDPEKEAPATANNNELGEEEQRRQQERLNALLQEHGVGLCDYFTGVRL